MSLASRIGIATMGYRGGYSGSGISETRYVLQEVQVTEMKDVFNLSISVESVGVDSLIEFIDVDVSDIEIEGAY